MPSPLFNLLGNQMPANMGNLIDQFNLFKSTFTGDPRAQVQQMLASGQMSQDQFNRFSQMATQMRKYIR